MPLAYYSTARTRQLRIGLFVALAVSALMLASAVALLVTGYVEFALSVGFPGALLLVACLLALRTVRGPDRSAKVSCVMAGILSVLVGIAFSTTVIGLLPLLTGVALIVLSLSKDPGPRETL